MPVASAAWVGEGAGTAPKPGWKPGAWWSVAAGRPARPARPALRHRAVRPRRWTRAWGRAGHPAGSGEPSHQLPTALRAQPAARPSRADLRAWRFPWRPARERHRPGQQPARAPAVRRRWVRSRCRRGCLSCPSSSQVDPLVLVQSELSDKMVRLLHSPSFPPEAAPAAGDTPPDTIRAPTAAARVRIASRCPVATTGPPWRATGSHWSPTPGGTRGSRQCCAASAPAWWQRRHVPHRRASRR